MEADAALRGLRFKVGRLVAQQQTRHGSRSRSLPGPPPALRMREATAPPLLPPAVRPVVLYGCRRALRLWGGGVGGVGCLSDRER